tara:strand:- start:3743 stop:4378 length:636 start_codon:yes stop_codon:yes gene_type:complete
MTNVRLHGVLAKEYGQNFCLSVGTPRNVLHAIDANRDGFIARVIQLHKEGCVYEILINKKRVKDQNEQDQNNPHTIDLVPAITGSGPIAAAIAFLGSGTLLANISLAIIFSAISFALSPRPEVEQIEATAQASKSSLVFSNIVNTASQGVPLPIGYGRLKVGSQVIQATIKSYPQHQTPEQALGRTQEADEILGLVNPNRPIITTSTASQQ